MSKDFKAERRVFLLQNFKTWTLEKPTLIELD